MNSMVCATRSAALGLAAQIGGHVQLPEQQDAVFLERCQTRRREVVGDQAVDVDVEDLHSDGVTEFVVTIAGIRHSFRPVGGRLSRARAAAAGW
jgi:hypothetical protein